MLRTVYHQFITCSKRTSICTNSGTYFLKQCSLNLLAITWTASFLRYNTDTQYHHIFKSTRWPSSQNMRSVITAGFYNLWNRAENSRTMLLIVRATAPRSFQRIEVHNFLLTFTLHAWLRVSHPLGVLTTSLPEIIDSMIRPKPCWRKGV